MSSGMSSPYLNPDRIKNALRTKTIGREIIYLDVIDSTNNEAKRRADLEADGTVILSEQQTAGRGRLGRNWVSPRGKGIWLTLILKPERPPGIIPTLALIGAAAVCLALDKTDNSLREKVKIKWPNDLWLKEKKLGGILTEMQAEETNTRWVVMGIGINVNSQKSDFPEELWSSATSLYLERKHFYDRDQLIAELLNSFEELYLNFLQAGIGRTLTICRQRSAVIGKKVILWDKGTAREAEALDLGPDGELVVRLPSGEKISLFSGEITLRLKGET